MASRYRHHQWCGAVLILQINVCMVLNKILDDIEVAAFNSIVKGSGSKIILEIDIFYPGSTGFQ